METRPQPNPNPAEPAPDREAHTAWAMAAAFVAAIVGRLPALGSWWTQDDWGLLGRAAGLVEPVQGLPARVLSQHLWWRMNWALFGLDPTPQAILRVLLHAGSAALVVAIGRRAGLRPLSAAIAGLVFAAHPVAFTPLYWASGVQELLAGFFALLAVALWLGGGRRDLLLASLAAVLSMASKESALALPLLLVGLLWTGAGVRLQDKAYAWALTMLLLLVAVIEGVLVMNHFGTAAGDPYALGGVNVVLANLGIFGVWLATPTAIFAHRLDWTLASVGLLVFLVWAAWAGIAWRRGMKLPAGAWAAALLSLGPALPLAGQIHPYLGYLASAALALTLASLVPARRRPATGAFAITLGVLGAVAVAWAYGGMQTRLGQRLPSGLPADPVVRTTSLSWATCRSLPDLPLDRREDGSPALTLLQFPLDTRTAEMAERLGPRWVRESELHEAVGGTTGPRLVLDDSVQVDWVNALFSSPAGALVLCESPGGFKHWGSTANACLYAALTDIAVGRFERARKHLIRGADLGGETFSFSWDEEQMIVPFQRSLDRKVAFVDWTVSRLDEGDASAQETGGLQDLYFHLLATCTGQTVEEITAGSELIRFDQPPAGSKGN